MRVTRYALTLVALYLSYLVLGPFLVALTWAALFAILFRRMQTGLAARMGPNGAATVSTLGILLMIVAPAALLLSALAREAPQIGEYFTQASREAPHHIHRMWAAARARSPFPMVDDPTTFVTNAVQRGAAMLASYAGVFLADSFATLGNLAAMVFALFFMLRDGDAMSRRLSGLLPFAPADNDRLLNDTRALVVASVGTGVAVAAADGLIGGMAFALTGVGAPVFWGAAIAFASFVPAVGAAIVWVPVGIWLLLSKAIWPGVFVLLVGVFGITLAGNVLRSLLLSNKTPISPLVVFVGVLGGAAAFGLVGLIVGPIVLVLTSEFLEILRRAASGQPATQ
jgi:predicted PurR-regulated permease PerM